MEGPQKELNTTTNPVGGDSSREEVSPHDLTCQWNIVSIPTSSNWLAKLLPFLLANRPMDRSPKPPEAPLHLASECGHKEAARLGIGGHHCMEQRNDDDGEEGDKKVSDELPCVNCCPGHEC